MDSTPRVPFISDPNHLTDVAGQAYACLRPGGEVLDIYTELQARIRSTAPWLSFPTAHCSLKGFGTSAWVVNEERLALCATVVSSVVRVSPPLELSIDGLDMFDEISVPIVRIHETAELRHVLNSLREEGARADCPGFDDAISPEDWVFHLSLAYPNDTRGARTTRGLLDRMKTMPGRCTVKEVELVFFDGGPERLVDVFSFAGSGRG
jgi:hypothetical protein